MRFADENINDDQEKICLLLPKTGQKDQEEKKKELSRKYLINRLNCINFKDGTVSINLKHVKFNTVISLQAKPQPCLDTILDCLWVETEGLKQKLRSYKYLHLVVHDNQKLILVEADLKDINEDGISFHLPEVCYEISSRRVKRHYCDGIQAQLVQNGAIFHGSLVDFSAVSFRIEVSSVPPQTFHWINPESSVTVIMKNDVETLYSGECEIIKQDCGQQTRAYVLKPLKDRIRRFKPREYRSNRHKLIPSPNVIFADPFSGKTVNLKVVDLSGSGFSVEEDEHCSVLMPGKIIPELSIDFANIFQITCKAQIIYRNVCTGNNNGRNLIRCGLAILDMDLQDHVKLLGLLHQAEDQNTYVCNKVDLDELWDFFFETGFVYPKKYSFIQTYKKKFQDTYAKLYTQNPNIARYFIYQQNGIIYGHMAMVRFYENTWLIQHHASRKSSSYKPGLLVLSQISRYVNEIHNLYSAHLHFVCCYFRPENKFPNRVFGGVARFINETKGCSVDNFAYFHYKNSSMRWDLSGPWMLTKTKSEDLRELEDFYKYESGGLMLHAMDLEPGMAECDDLNKEYERMGFKRERHLFSLKKNDVLKAIIMINISDIGLNMSDLTNCLKIIVLDGNDLSKDTLYSMLSLVSVKFEHQETPVLLYPVSYAEKQFIPYEKIYSLWVLNLQYLDQYFRFCDKVMSHAENKSSNGNFKHGQ